MNWNKFLELFSDSEICGNKILIKSSLKDAIRFIYENYKYDLFKQIIGVDRGSFVELIYNLYSTDDEENLFISIHTSNECETITDIFPAAYFDECEIFDLFGITFVGNDNLIRLYMPNSWIGNPLKKDYKFEDVRLNWND